MNQHFEGILETFADPTEKFKCFELSAREASHELISSKVEDALRSSYKEPVFSFAGLEHCHEAMTGFILKNQDINEVDLIFGLHSAKVVADPGLLNPDEVKRFILAFKRYIYELGSRQFRFHRSGNHLNRRFSHLVLDSLEEADLDDSKIVHVKTIRAFQKKWFGTKVLARLFAKVSELASTRTLYFDDSIVDQSFHLIHGKTIAVDEEDDEVFDCTLDMDCDSSDSTGDYNTDETDEDGENDPASDVSSGSSIVHSQLDLFDDYE